MAQERALRGSPGRRPRLSDAETQERMLAAGERFVAGHGLSLSLEHLSMEDLIRDAGVSRTSSYRRWPTKDQFAADLLVRLAQAHLADDLGYLTDALSDLPADLLDGLDSPAGRRDAFVEVLRRTLVDDFALTAGSPTWRAYLTLRAAHVGLPEGELRDEVAAALRETERGFTDTRAAALRAMARLAGYRLRDARVVDWATLSLFLSGLVTGMVVRAYSDPDAVTAPRHVAPFGSRRAAEWSPAALGAASLLLDALEPDPDLDWDADRVARLRGALTDIPGTLQALWAEVTAGP